MNNRVYLLQQQKKSTNHILHLILTLLTGFWVVVWIGLGVSNSVHNKEIDHLISEELNK